MNKPEQNFKIRTVSIRTKKKRTLHDVGKQQKKLTITNYVIVVT